jgi:glycosyltransferase involved in cell wall biosynthesis
MPVSSATNQPAVPAFRKLSIFYPMWNEEEYIGRAVDAGRRAALGLVEAGEIVDFELIVIDDASTDATGRIADELAATDAQV